MREQLRLPSLKVHPAVKVKEAAGGGKDGAKDGGKEAKAGGGGGGGGRDPAGSYRVLEACSTEAAADGYCAAREALIIYVNRCASGGGVGAGKWAAKGSMFYTASPLEREHPDFGCRLAIARPVSQSAWPAPAAWRPRVFVERDAAAAFGSRGGSSVPPVHGPPFPCGLQTRAPRSVTLSLRSTPSVPV